MELFANIVDRFIIHFFASTSLVLLVYFFMGWLKRRNVGFLQTVPMELIVAGLTVFAVSTLREAYDVSVGQPLLKAFTDYFSWMSGCAISVWAIYRLRHL